MAGPANTGDNVANQLEKAEASVEKLTKALNHWRQWKEDYQTLKEDINILPATPTRDDLARTRNDFVGDLLDAKELGIIFGHNDSKTPDQIISQLGNRLDYVEKNIETLQRQLEAAQDQLASVTGSKKPESADEDELPITEIMEELDDEDNVVSYNLRRPGDNEAQLMEALKRSGLAESSSSHIENANTVSGTKTAANNDSSTKQSSRVPPSRPTKQTVAEKPTKAIPAPEKRQVKKTVAFAEDTKPAESSSATDTKNKVKEIMKSAREQEDIIAEPILPVDEPEDDAALRQDMISYNTQTMMYEMAPIVAELNLEEASDIETDEYSDYDEDDDEDDEDQYGRSTKSVVDDDWKRQMLEIQARLSNHTFGAEDSAADEDDDRKAAGVGRITVKGGSGSIPVAFATPEAPPEVPSDPAPDRSTPSAPEGKKSVRFAQSLDTAQEKPVIAAEAPAKQVLSPATVTDPLGDVMERTGPPPAPSAAPSKPKRASRFKKGRAQGEISSGPTFQGMPLAQPQPDNEETRYAPSGPEGQVLSDTVMEHTSSADPREPDEFDDSLLKQQVTEEYYKARNKFIHRQGGFMKENEEPIQPLAEEEGGPKKMSRFKTARLAHP